MTKRQRIIRKKIQANIKNSTMDFKNGKKWEIKKDMFTGKEIIEQGFYTKQSNLVWERNYK